MHLSSCGEGPQQHAQAQSLAADAVQFLDQRKEFWRNENPKNYRVRKNREKKIAEARKMADIKTLSRALL